MQEYLGRFTAIVEPVAQSGMDRGESTPGGARQATLAVGFSLEGTFLLRAYAPGLVQPQEQLRAGLAPVLEGLKASK